MVMAHPHGDSLTAQVAARAEARLEADGVAVDLLDLHAEGFNPRMTRADEPAWGDRDKTYSAEVVAHMRPIDTADLIVVVFPVGGTGCRPSSRAGSTGCGTTDSPTAAARYGWPAIGWCGSAASSRSASGTVARRKSSIAARARPSRSSRPMITLRPRSAVGTERGEQPHSPSRA
jgi:Flavodoxin-like fold